MRHLYLHIPFCHRRCSYCDFNTYANMEHRIEAYVDALCQELVMLRDQLPPLPASPEAAALRPSIFFGGGTPSMLSPAQIERILQAAAEIVPLTGAEISLEANPGTVLGRDYLRDLRRLGINRLSMGVQSLHDPTLRMLGRIHTAAEAYASFNDARAVGFESINLDFIFGLPGQDIEQWRATLTEIIRWEVDHIALYSLILEENTPLYAQVTAGRLQIPDDDLTGAMYELAMETLGAAGYRHYEISNWVRHLHPTAPMHHRPWPVSTTWPTGSTATTWPPVPAPMATSFRNVTRIYAPSTATSRLCNLVGDQSPKRLCLHLPIWQQRPCSWGCGSTSGSDLPTSPPGSGNRCWITTVQRSTSSVSRD